MKDEALKLALEALELHGKQYPHMVKGYCLDAITAIKQALAAPVQEPLFWYKPYPGGMYYGPIHNAQIGDILRGIEEWLPLYTTPTAQPAPVQEPVAYWIPKAEQFCIADPSGRPFAKAWEPLYTTPPAAQRQWVGLTDEEIESLDCVYVNWLDYEQVETKGEKEFARAIEAKLKEKNNG